MWCWFVKSQKYSTIIICKNTQSCQCSPENRGCVCLAAWRASGNMINESSVMILGTWLAPQKGHRSKWCAFQELQSLYIICGMAEKNWEVNLGLDNRTDTWCKKAFLTLKVQNIWISLAAGFLVKSILHASSTRESSFSVMLFVHKTACLSSGRSFNYALNWVFCWHV